MARLGHIFSSRDREFFDLFEEAAGNVVHGADLLDQMLAHYPDRKDLARDIVICEQEGDRIAHDIIHRLNENGHRQAPFDSADGSSGSLSSTSASSKAAA